ncbi:MAG: extracellular solute-binding protein, partial [Clostridia bacterium]|nr:extracellular solute-binding protein [Clostridia bacterium]
MKNKRLLSLLLLTAMLASTACGGDAPAADDTTAADAGETTTAAPETEAYQWADIDLGGREVTLLNVPLTLWNMNTELDFEAQTGETLDDAIYNRNRDAEEKLNFKLKVIHNSGYHDGSLNNAIRTDVMSGDGVYDAAYAYGADVGSLMADDALMNLKELSGLQLDQPWWIQTTMEQATIKDVCYFAHSYLSLTAFDLTWCLFFNEAMMEDLNIDKPYDLVREGKWTLDALRKLSKAGAQLNGDADWNWKDDGNAVYGFCAMHSGALAQIIGCGGLFSEKDAKGLPTLAVGSER